jgi:fibronectin-binding autotransporter adhesin
MSLDLSGTVSGGGGGGGPGGRAGGGGDGIVAATGSSVEIRLEDNAGVQGGNGVGLGAGGAGLRLQGGGTVTNAGTIQGGGSDGYRTGGVPGLAGGTGSGGAPGFVPNAAAQGDGGTGIIGVGLEIINSGTIAGGTGHAGQANAITFTGGTNRLELRDGFSFTGAIVAYGTNDTLALGGDTSPVAPFDVSGITDNGGGGQYRGFGNFEKAGDSTWVLTGTTGAVTPWTLRQGTLSVSSDANLGAVSGELALDGGTLRNTADFATERSITLDGIGGTFWTDAGLTVETDITGTGGLTKAGAGDLTLMGSNSYTGTTIVDAGNLIARSADAFPQNAAYVVNDGLLDLNGHDLTMSQLSGTGGTVALGTGELKVDQDTSTDYAGQLAGNGAFILGGTGVLLLTGDSSAFTGTTTVSGGTLLVGNAVGAGVLGGTVNVGADGTLGGSGHLSGSVAVDGTLSAGNSPGTLSIDGNLSLNAGSTSFFDFNTPGVVGGTGAGGNDLVEVGGTLALGGTLEARVAAAGYYRLACSNMGR